MTRALAEARALGFLGPGPLAAHQQSASAFVEALGPLPPGTRLLDLGSGGGVPGLILAAHYRETSWVLLDANRRRTSFLARVVAELGWNTRVEVVRRAAEDAGRRPEHRSTYDVVVSRSFASPATTAECAAAFLKLGGRLVVAEPPESRGARWPASPIATLGLRLVTVDRVAVLAQVAPYPEDAPRTWKVMERSPRW